MAVRSTLHDGDDGLAKTAVGRVVQRLRSAMVSGDVPPGSPLVEAALVNALGASRTTVREALRILVAEGLVVHQPHRGFVVRRLTLADAKDIYAVRQVLEVEALHSVRRVPTTKLETMAAAVEALTRHVAAADWLAFARADLLFHRELVSLLGSRRLDEFFANLLSELRLALSIVDRTMADADQVIAEHLRLFDLLAEGRRDAAEALLLRHLRSADDLLRAVIRSSETGAWRGVRGRVRRGRGRSGLKLVAPTERRHDDGERIIS